LSAFAFAICGLPFRTCRLNRFEYLERASGGAYGAIRLRQAQCLHPNISQASSRRQVRATHQTRNRVRRTLQL
jgi:hypothetical protein